MGTPFAPEHPATAAPVWLWPSLGKAATLLRVSPAAISRLGLPTQVCGREHKLAPTTVLQLADRYRRRSTTEVTEVAALLVEIARPLAKSRDELTLVEDEVSQYFSGTAEHRRSVDHDDWWLREAKRRLPEDVYQNIVLVTSTEPLGAIRGARPDHRPFADPMGALRMVLKAPETWLVTPFVVLIALLVFGITFWGFLR